jgi:hypothetical protein
MPWLQLMYGLMEKRVLVAITGTHKNVVLFTPPMCFTIENARSDISLFFLLLFCHFPCHFFCCLFFRFNTDPGQGFNLYANPASHQVRPQTNADPCLTVDPEFD